MADIVEIPTYGSLDALCSNGIGRHEEYFFQNNDDWSKVLVFFNGAVGPVQRRLGYAYQRWTWTKQFRHPVFIIADPATYGTQGLTLGWYMGKRETYYLPSALDKVSSFVHSQASNAQLVTFGSSAGGFAALASLQLGYADVAFAVNPQTDVEKYWPKYPARFMLNLYGGRKEYEPDHLDRGRLSLLDMGFGKAKTGAKILYAQNSADSRHYENHMHPYVEALSSLTDGPKLSAHVFHNEKLAHNPPPLSDLVKIFGGELQSLLKA